MSYIQFSLCGISAIVKQEDTLSAKEITSDRIFYTPAYKELKYFEYLRERMV